MSYQNCEGPSIDTISTGVEIGGINICIVISYYPFISKPFDISLFLLTSPLPLPLSHTSQTASIWRQVGQKSKSGKKKASGKEGGRGGGGGETTQQLSYEEEEQLAKSRFSLTS